MGGVGQGGQKNGECVSVGGEVICVGCQDGHGDGR